MPPLSYDPRSLSPSGESKPLAPFPDAIDDDKAEASTCAWAQKEGGWGAGPVRWDIQGTNVSTGSIQVVAWTDAKRRILTLDPKTYAVKDVLE